MIGQLDGSRIIVTDGAQKIYYYGQCNLTRDMNQNVR